MTLILQLQTLVKPERLRKLKALKPHNYERGETSLLNPALQRIEVLAEELAFARAAPQPESSDLHALCIPQSEPKGWNVAIEGLVQVFLFLLGLRSSAWNSLSSNFLAARFDGTGFQVWGSIILGLGFARQCFGLGVLG